MPDLNDLSRPVTTDTEPNVLDTLRANIVRAATWTGWGATANKVAGMMSAVTTAVSGGRSLRLYRRNDGNTSDEEIVSLPGVSVGGNAGTASAVAWSGVTGKPSTVAGYGITDMSSQSVAYASSAGTASAAPWSGVTGKPSTVAGYGITDMSGQSVGYAASAGNANTVSTITTAQVLNATAGALAGAVGCHLFAVPVGVSATPSAIVSGANLRASDTSNRQFTSISLSGTWRSLGHSQSTVGGGGVVIEYATLFVRIA